MKPPKASKEQQVLFKLLKGDLPTSLDGIDTRILFDLFRRHRLFALANSLLEFLDQAECERWKKVIIGQTLRSLHYTAELTAYVKEFKENGIDCISLKGPALAQALYGSVTERQYRDLDILVKREDIDHAIKVAKEIGYSHYYPKPGLSAKRMNQYLKSRKEVGLKKTSTGSIIELHTGIYFHQMLKKSESSVLYENLADIKVNETEVRCLSLENNFLYLTYHAGWHLYFRLFWLRDIAFAITHWDLDHYKILKLSKQLGIDRLLGCSLLLMEEFMGIEIPVVYHKYLNSNRTLLNRMKTISFQFIIGQEIPNFKMRMSKLVYYLSVKRGWKYKISVLINPIRHWYIRNFLD